MKKALIYGISGQDGPYLSGLLAEKGYLVAGVGRPGAAWPPVEKRYPADLAGEPEAFLAPLDEFGPDEVYNLAAVSSYAKCKKNPALAFRVNALAPLSILQRIAAMGTKVRFFQASTGYIFEGRQGRVDEKTAPLPISEYAKGKLEAHLAVKQARSKGVFACSGILFNHESPRRGENFVTRKISLGAAKIKEGMAGELALGNLDAKRDWGFAGDYVEAMWLMLQQKEPDDYVIATGETHSVKEFCEEAFSHVGLDWKAYVKSDPALVRAEGSFPQADAGKARKKLGWKPKVGFKELVRMMVDADIKGLRNGV